MIFITTRSLTEKIDAYGHSSSATFSLDRRARIGGHGVEQTLPSHGFVFNGRKKLVHDVMLGSNVKHTVTIEIAGTRYTMVSDAPPERLEELAEIVNERIAAFGPSAQRAVNSGQLLAMVALGLAEELEGQKAARAELEAKVRAIVEGTIDRIDARLAELRKGRP